MERVDEIHVRQNVQQLHRVRHDHIVVHEQVAVRQNQGIDTMWRMRELVHQVYVQHDIIEQMHI